jgi:hypothetical protein
MDVTRADATMLLYNYAVVLSGGWIAMTLNVSDRVLLLGITLLPAIVWTVYFRLRMLSLLADALGTRDPADAGKAN